MNVQSHFYVAARGCSGFALLLGPFATYDNARAKVQEAMGLAQGDPEVWAELLGAAECGGLFFGVVEADCTRAGLLNAGNGR